MRNWTDEGDAYRSADDDVLREVTAKALQLIPQA